MQAIQYVEVPASSVFSDRNREGYSKDKSKAAYNYSEVQDKVNELCSVPAKKSMEEIAKEVIRGEWGNGSDRKNRLQAAGYDYSEVQSKVNALLK